MSCDQERGVYMVLGNRREGRRVLVLAAERVLVLRRAARGTALRNSQSKQCSSGASWLGGESLKIWVTGGMLGHIVMITP